MSDKNKCCMPHILNYIQTNYHRKIYLNELAKIGKYNTSYFSVVFKESTGLTLTDYIKIIRISHAKKMLLETNYSVEKISSTVGYPEKKQFYRLFKDIVGLTPSQYRSGSNVNCLE